MSQYILLNRIQVQGANAVSGFTWGYPAITHFLGYVHNLHRRLNPEDKSKKPLTNIDISLQGCAVIAHHHQVHTYGYNQFVQSKNPAYQKGEQPKYKVGTPPVIEEGKMDLTVSLLIKYEGYLGGSQQEPLLDWLYQACQRQRLAGGMILDIAHIEFISFGGGDSADDRQSFRLLIRKLLPGFALHDRSQCLENRFNSLKKHDEEAGLFDAWLDFIALKQKARPVFNLISKQLEDIAKTEPDSYRDLLEQWQSHLNDSYEQAAIPEELKNYFDSLNLNDPNNKLLKQWQDYCLPNEQTDAIWEYVKKPELGFLVPIMIGYKGISDLYDNNKQSPFPGARDCETKVRFVEAVHSIGEWRGIHRIKNEEELEQLIWQYDVYHDGWYLCKQGRSKDTPILKETVNDDFS